MKKIINKINELCENIKICIDNSKEISKNLNGEFDNFLIWLKRMNDYSKKDNNIFYQKYLKGIDKEYNSLKELNLYKNDIIYEINKNNEKLIEKYNQLKTGNFSPNENSINFSFTESKSTYTNTSNISNNKNLEEKDVLLYGNDFLDDYKEEENNNNINDNFNNYKCFECQNEANVLYKKKNIYSCENCFNILLDKYEIDIDNDIINLNNIVTENEELKKKFLNSIEILIKNILINCNYILNTENKICKDINNINNNINIKKKIDYPYIKDKGDYDSHINFLKDISNLVKDDNGNNLNLNDEDLGLTKLNKDLIESFKNVFKDKQFEYYKNLIIQIDKIDDDFQRGKDYSNEGQEEEEEEDEEFVNECYKRDDKKENKKKILNEFYCLINFISKKNINLIDDKLKKIITDKINKILKKILLNEKQDIFVSFNNKKNLQDYIIRTDEFEKMELKEIKNYYPNLNEVYEIKDIIENLLIKKCRINKDLIDYKGNFIIPNKSYNHKGKEIYYPPNGWIGIGLKVLQKYENDEWINDNSPKSKWAIAYHGVGGGLTSNKVLEKLIKKINNGLENGNLQSKSHYYDKRHPNKRIGTGIYLSPDINIAENYSGIISFRNEKYKIALMTKVMIDKIKEPDDINLWILNKSYIRNYRILFKKLNN